MSFPSLKQFLIYLMHHHWILHDIFFGSQQLRAKISENHPASGWDKNTVTRYFFLLLLSLSCFNMFISFNFFIPALLGIVFLCCRVFEIVKVGSSTLLAELSFWHAFYLIVRVIHVANIHVTCLVYIHTFCVPIATLNQNKRSQLLYLANAQIIIIHTY